VSEELSTDDLVELEFRARDLLFDAALWSLLLAVMLAPFACAFACGRWTA